MKKNIILMLAILLAGSLAAVSAQSKLQTNPGGYHGELDYPMSWKRYYGYEEWTKIMRELQKKYPQLADIQSIGKSRMGRDQLLLTITAKSTGKPETKRAMWVDGAIHGNEVNGITCSLYLAWYLLTRYDYDPFVHEILDRTTFYILPGLNVDANDSYVRFPNTENNPREPYRPADDDGDGLFDEDQTEDVDGDGELSVMYVEDPAGEFKLSPDKRRFVRVDDIREEVRRFRRVGAEGFDNDGDGQINEDDIGGPDPNRNFPYGWSLDAGYPYPMSEAETRNVFEFQLTLPNIFASFHYHNTGRLIMFQAPPAVRPPAGQAPGAPAMGPRAQQTVQQRLEELRKTDKYAYLADRQVAPEYQHDLDVQNEIVSAGARILKDYTPTIGGLSGQAHAATYYMFGAYSYLIELWGSPAFEADIDSDGQVSEEEFMKWVDIELMGEGWVLPHKAKHPDVGEVWIGGTSRKHVGRTPPARYIETEALRNANFVLYAASQFPKIDFGEVKVTPATGDLYWVEVEVKNDKAYPTSSDRAVALKRAVMDRITASAGGGAEIVEVPAASTAVDPWNRAAQSEVVAAKGTEFRLKGHETKRFCVLVKMTGAAGSVEFAVRSKMGGPAAKRITLKAE
ncbi:MAG: hypothetical protein A2W20_09505 [Candidatus Aminicenantes bacterium RBG_16_66_30]|nr:MAG: hypothetical protein A2W20_09505 [Candidatus Aminicenantes bacterium RBG_16_66_30]